MSESSQLRVTSRCPCLLRSHCSYRLGHLRRAAYVAQQRVEHFRLQHDGPRGHHDHVAMLTGKSIRCQIVVRRVASATPASVQQSLSVVMCSFKLQRALRLLLTRLQIANVLRAYKPEGGGVPLTVKDTISSEPSSNFSRKDLSAFSVNVSCAALPSVLVLVVVQMHMDSGTLRVCV
jgi:hypothetical protein